MESRPAEWSLRAGFLSVTVGLAIGLTPAVRISTIAELSARNATSAQARAESSVKRYRRRGVSDVTSSVSSNRV